MKPASLQTRGLLIATLEPVITALVAIPLLGEWMDGGQWLGAGLIVLAALIIARPRSAIR